MEEMVMGREIVMEAIQAEANQGTGPNWNLKNVAIGIVGAITIGAACNYAGKKFKAYRQSKKENKAEAEVVTAPVAPVAPVVDEAFVNALAAAMKSAVRQGMKEYTEELTMQYTSMGLDMMKDLNFNVEVKKTDGDVAVASVSIEEGKKADPAVTAA